MIIKKKSLERNFCNKIFYSSCCSVLFASPNPPNKVSLLALTSCHARPAALSQSGMPSSTARSFSLVLHLPASSPFSSSLPTPWSGCHRWQHRVLLEPWCLESSTSLARSSTKTLRSLVRAPFSFSFHLSFLFGFFISNGELRFLPIGSVTVT